VHIGVLTGGGDCPGLNAAIRAVTRASLERGWSVTGLHDGWAGVLGRNGSPLTVENTDGFLDVGGTLLGSSRTNPLRTPENYALAVAVFDDMGLDGLVAIGGDDTLSVAGALAGDGLPVVGIPKTIDNDVPGTDVCIGFDTAVETVASSIARLRTTTMSHHRVTVVEAMGRQAGWLAAVGGLAGGADFIAVPEQRSQIDAYLAHVQRRYKQGRAYSIVVVAEGAEIDGLEVGEAGVQATDEFGHIVLAARSVGESLARTIENATGIETRSSVLGHLQRGGTPTTFDRVLGTRFGAAAVGYLASGQHGQMAAQQGPHIKPVPLVDIAGKTRPLDDSYLELLNLFA
jgi:6-phosphofructokinase 1